ncbi:MAG: hypothetical protein ACPLKQ_06010 [Candidatus Bathyarchaeales archaeon]
MTTNNKQWDEILLEAVDEALQTVLGESGKEVIYYYFQNSYAIKKEDIPEKPELFIEFLKKLFGVGAELIENTILKNLCQKLGIKPEQAENAKLAEFLRKINHKE